MCKHEEGIKALNTKYNELVSELFEEVLCDKCRKTIKIGTVNGKLVDYINNETLLLCPECTEKMRAEIKHI